MKQVYRNLIFLCLFLMIVGCIWYFGNLTSYIQLSTIKDHQYFLRSQINQRPICTAFLYILIFFIATLSAFPATLIFIVTGGFLFGTALGSLYAFFAMLASSICIFKLSKKMFGRYLQEKYADQLKRFNENFKKYGFYYLVAVRSIPIIPFFIVNLAAGLTAIDSKTFIFSTALGTLPTILFCSYLGSQCASYLVNW